MSQILRDTNDKHKASETEGQDSAQELPEEIGGYKGHEPTKYGDWQHKGKVSDF